MKQCVLAAAAALAFALVPADAGQVQNPINADSTLVKYQLVTGNGPQSAVTLGSLGTTTTVLHGNAGGAPSFGAVNLATDVTGSIGAGNLPSLTSADIWVGNGSSVATAVSLSGDAALSNAGALTLATVNSNVGSFGSTTTTPVITVNAKGLITAATTATVASAGANANITALSGLTGQIDISNGTWTSSATAIRLGADASASTRTNNTSKLGMIISYPYANAALNIEGILFQNTSTQNIIQVGGGTGTSSLYGATEIDMNTAPTVSTTASSTLYGLRVDSSQHVLLSSSNSPTAASNGTAATCTDKCYDTIGRFTVGASPNASLVVTFAANPTAWPQKPVCFGMDETAGVNMPVSAIATTAVTFTKTTTLTASDQVSYHCFGAR